MGKDISVFEKIAELMEDSGIDPETGMYTGKQYTRHSFATDDEDSEAFFTSKEIVKMEQIKEAPDHKIPMRPNEYEESLHYKRYTTQHIHKYTDKEMDEIRKSCLGCLVHDYSEYDIYHMSDEERAKIDSLNDIAAKLSTLKKTYRQVDQYVIAMRIFIEAWELLEQRENFIHSDEEFWQMIADGRIYNGRIILPRLKNIDKYNKDLLIQYISNPDLDPADLISQEQQSQDSWYYNYDEEPEEDEEESLKRLLSPEEVQFILNYENSPVTFEARPFKRSEIKGYDNRGFHRFRTSKKKKLSKRKKYLQDNLYDLLRKIQANPANYHDDEVHYNRAALITTSMFEPPKKVKNPLDIRFNGSWVNKNDVFLYDLAVREQFLQTYVPGQALTFGDTELRDVFNAMDEEGMNTVYLRKKMNMTSTADKRTAVKRQRRSNRKTESRLLQRITKLNHNPKFKKLVSKAEKEMNKE